ncbi:11-beta-hydroxysteroid dehydrogenase 1B, partial [Cucurbita argyrosperma subsp. argyrosperma]
MELIQSFLNLVAPPFTVVSLGLLLPHYVVFKYFFSLVRGLFSEDVTGKVVLITGASSGIGENLAYEYAKRGAQLALVARRESSLEEAAEAARYYGSPEVITIAGDVSELSDCRRIIDDTMNHFGRLDHLVNNAGIANMTLFEEIIDITSFKKIMETNYWGSVYMTWLAIPYLKNRGGKIIVASKAALRSFFETLRVEMSPEIGITVVTPGFVESEITKGKALYSHGRMEVHQDVRDALVGAIPVETAAACAKAIVRSACQGDRYLTEPSWYNAAYYLKAFCPEVVEWCYRILVYTTPGTSAAEALNKQILDLTGAKTAMYPPSIHSHMAYEYAKRGAYLALVARRENRLREVAGVARFFGSPFALDVNFWGMVYCTYFAIPHLKQSRGKIIGISSSAAWLPVPRLSFYSASKAAVISFYETLRVEVGRDIGITIVTPGLVESEMTQGKFMSKDGGLYLDQELRDAMVSAMPIMAIDSAVNGIVRSACRGDRYATEPRWMRMAFYYKTLWPELVEWVNYLIGMTSSSPTDSFGKRLLELTGLKTWFYPESVRSQKLWL